jgi:hypothetical protein
VWKGGVACSPRFYGGGMKHDVRGFSMLFDDSFRVLKAELNDKQLTKCTYLRKLTLSP